MFFNRLFRTTRTRPAARLSVEALDDRIVPAGVFSIGSAQILEGNTGTPTAVVTVTLDGTHGNNTTVNYTTEAGSAQSGIDYIAVSGKLTFAKNETTKTILVPVRGDQQAEPDEYFSVRLSGAKGAKIAQGVGYVHIEDDEPRAFVTNGSAVEGDDAGTTSLTFTVQLTTAYDLPVTVNYATADGTAVAGLDYEDTSGSWTFPAGQTSHEIAVTVLGDRAPEQDERFTVGLTSPNNFVAILGPAEQTIIDNEPRISVGDTYLDANAGTFTFVVFLHTAYDQTLTVSFATADGTAVAGIDYDAASDGLTFLPGETSKQVTITAINLTPDYYLYFTLGLSGASANAQIWYGTGTGWWYYDNGGGGGDCGCWSWW